MPSRRSRSKLDKILDMIRAGKHYGVLRELGYIKKKCELVKELRLKYRADEKEKFLQVTVPSPSTYILYIVYRRERVVGHRFYLKESGIKHVRGREYHVISMRIPSELRNSTLYVRIFRVRV